MVSFQKSEQQKPLKIRDLHEDESQENLKENNNGGMIISNIYSPADNQKQAYQNRQDSADYSSQMKPLRTKSPTREIANLNNRSSRDGPIVDIQTEDYYYTEVFSWGSDHQG